MRYLAAVCVVLTWMMVTPAAGQAPDANLVEIEAEGEGMDKDESVRAALRQAVERGAGTFISSQSETRDFTLVRDTVLARSAGFVQSHQIIRQEQAMDGVWKTSLRAVVSVQGVEDVWGAVTTLLQQVGRPKIMVFLTETVDGGSAPVPTVQTGVESILLDSGFLLVDRGQVQAIVEKDKASAVAEDSPARLQAIAKRFGAQLYVSGSAEATSGGTNQVAGMELHTYKAQANLRCYRSDTGELLSSTPGTPTRGVDRAPEAAARKALALQAEQIAPAVRMDILEHWRDALSGRGEVKLIVEGLSFRQYLALKKSLAELESVSDVSAANFANQVAECSLQSDLRAELLAEKMLAELPHLDITDVTQNVIKARAIE